MYNVTNKNEELQKNEHVGDSLTNGFEFGPRKCSMTFFFISKKQVTSNMKCFMEMFHDLQATSNKFSEKLKMAAFSIRKRPGHYLVWGHNTAFLERREYLASMGQRFQPFNPWIFFLLFFFLSTLKATDQITWSL